MCVWGGGGGGKTARARGRDYKERDNLLCSSPLRVVTSESTAPSDDWCATEIVSPFLPFKSLLTATRLRPVHFCSELSHQSLVA